MAKRDVFIVENNLVVLRDKHGLSQEKLAKILGIKRDILAKYENGTENLPINLAMKLCRKFGYSLDWIYCNVKTSSRNFMIDIRELITCDDNKIHISLSQKNMDYIEGIYEIDKSEEKGRIKDYQLSQLSDEYINNSDKSNIVCRISIPKEEFNSFIQNGNSLIPYSGNSDDKAKHTATKEQNKEIKDFFKKALENE